MAEDSRDIAVCATCELSQEDCECYHCAGCNENYTDAPCSNCNECQECCECHVCARSRCTAIVERVCERCERCEECCECSHCASCEEPCEYTCGNCDCCEYHCDCTYCEGCHESHESDTSFCSDCERCDDTCECEDSSRHIQSYNTDVTESKPFQGKPDGGSYLGAELETQTEGDLDDKAEAWVNALGDFGILKEDGSIGHGFEIVTAPCSLDVHASKWTELLSDTELVRGMKSWNASRNTHGDTCCGMHVHISRKPISQLTIGKLLVFVNSPKNTKEIEAIAGRPSVYYSRIIEKKLTDALFVCSECPKLKKERNGFCRRCKKSTYGYASSDHNRYQAINLQNDDTIEFRIFRGTLLLEHVLANLQFVDAVVRWCMQCSIQECEDWSSFWAYVLKHSKTYKQLVSYLTPKLR